MTIGVLRFELRLFSPKSLKEKRAIIKPLKNYLQTNFNVSVAELDKHDSWQMSDIGIAMISNDNAFIHKCFDSISTTIESRFPVIITSKNIEIL